MKAAQIVSTVILLVILGFATGYSQGPPSPAGQEGEVQRLPAVEVEASGPQLGEEAVSGPYSQPEWTTARRFPTTRVYVQQPPGGFGFEQWVKAQSPRDEKPNYLFQEEFEFGLPHRLQIDLYENWLDNTTENDVRHDSFSAEVRWALADWGKIPLNPTLYGEWTFRNHYFGEDKYELKLLLGDELMSRLHWGANLIYEQEVAGAKATELGLTNAISYTLLDEKLSLGAELKVESETEEGQRSNPPLEVDLGPSLQWRPLSNVHVDLVPLFGLNNDSPRVETWFVVGIDFGPGHKGGKEGHAPVSNRSR